MIVKVKIGQGIPPGYSADDKDIYFNTGLETIKLFIGMSNR